MKLIIPTDLSDITLGQLQALTKLEATPLNDLERQKQTIELLTSIDRTTIDKVKLGDLNDVYGKLLSLSKASEGLHQFVKIDNISVLPNLIVFIYDLIKLPNIITTNLRLHFVKHSHS